METVITRDTDIIREYLAVLDARERELSPLARFVATVKLAKLRRELGAVQIESTDQELLELRREVSERINRTGWRRFIARPWGSRLFILATQILGQQLILAATLLITKLFIRFAPVPKRWNPVLPHEQPGFLFVFIFLFFFATPMLATLVVFGGRYFAAWRMTTPATVLLIGLSVLATILVARANEKTNPVRHSTSLEQLARDRDLTVAAYRQWTESVWLTRDPQFQRDYETYFRSGPGRWITARLASDDDSAWQTRTDEADVIKLMSSYLDSAQDEDGFREWLKYYFERNRIYSEDRIEQEISSITGSANQRYLGVWQMEPFLKERDQRLYRRYLGTIDAAMYKWGLGWLGLLTLVFGVLYLVSATNSLLSRFTGRASARVLPAEGGVPPSSGLNRSSLSFPERSRITTPAFFDTPLRLLAGVHRSFLKLAVGMSILVFVFWGCVYALALTGDPQNPSSQIDLMSSHLLIPGPEPEAGRPKPPVRPSAESVTYVTAYAAGVEPGEKEKQRAAQSGESGRIDELAQQVEDSDYKNSRRYKEQYAAIQAQRSELSSLRGTTSQLQQTTTGLPEQLNELGSRASAAEARAGQVGSEAAAARQSADQLAAKIKDVETRAARASDQVGRVEGQVSSLVTRTEALDRELERRARQIEARTEELGVRTEDLKEANERIQRIAFASILSELTATADELDRRVTAASYRLVSRADTRLEAAALSQRIKALSTEVQDLKVDAAPQWLAELEALAKRVDDIVSRIK
jgi:hypothetical protein